VRISETGPDGNPSFDANAPAVAYDGTANRFLVVWQANDTAGSGQEIYGRFVSATGAPLGAQMRISDMGPEGDTRFDALKPAVAYNARAGEYLVVWYGDDGIDDELEIYGQRLSATGAQVGANDFRISQVGPDGDERFDAFRPSVASDPETNEYLVAWYADVRGDNEFEIYGQRLSAPGAEVGANDFRISDMGPEKNESFDAFKPAVAFASGAHEYLVVWYGDDGVDDELEIYGQRLSAAGAALGANDFRISHMGPDGSHAFQAARPDAAYDSQTNEYLVAWDGDDDRGGLVDNEFEIFGQRLSAAGSEVGANDFRVSETGPVGSNRFDSLRPAVAYDPSADQFLVAWYGDDGGDSEFEIYGQGLTATGGAVGQDDFRISHMGPDGSASFGAEDPAVAYGDEVGQYLAIWAGDDSTPPLVDDEFEVFGRGVAGGAEGGVPGVDRRAPHLKLRARKRQRLLRQRAVIVFAVCDEAASLDARARLTLRRRGRRSKAGAKVVKLKRIQRVLGENRRAKLRFRLSRKARRSVRRALRRHRRIVARVSVRATDAARNSTTRAVKVRARR
jgi:hypothetical protein